MFKRIVSQKSLRQLLVALTVIGTAGTASAQALSIATSNPGSIYHGSGQVLAKMLTEKADLKTTIQPFASPSVFIPAVNSGEIPLGLANIADLTWAVKGKEHFKGRPYTDIRAIAVAYPLRSTIFVRKDSDIKTLADLKGKRVVDGFTSQKVILPILDAMYATAGLTSSDMTGVQIPNVGAGADAFAAGKADMFFFALGAAKPREVDAAVGGIRMLSIPDTPAALAAIKKHYSPGYIRAETPSPGNVGVLEPSNSLAYDALVFSSAKTPDAVAYAVAKLMYENAKELGKDFPPFRLFDTKLMVKDFGPLNYHPGALKFYREVGLVK